MNQSAEFITSLKQKPGTIMLMWTLLLLNIMVIYVLIKGLTMTVAVVFTVLCVIGILMISVLSKRNVSYGQEQIEFQASLNNLMQEIRPLCDEIYERQLNNTVQTLQINSYDEFARGLSWLWEQVDDFYLQVEAEMAKGRTIYQFINSINNTRIRMVQKIQRHQDEIDDVLIEINNSREKYEHYLNKNIEKRIDNFKDSLENEKEFFYEYVYKILSEQIGFNDEDTNVLEYFNINKLGEQFTVVITKSIDNRLTAFQELLVLDMENLSADVVGSMQKYTMQLMNHFREMQDGLGQLMDRYEIDDTLPLLRISEYRDIVSQLYEKTGEILITLAWQDIMIERRWHEVQQNLLVTRDKVMDSIDEKIPAYIEEILNDEIPGFISLERTPEIALFYKAVIDAEVVYEVYEGQKLPDTLTDGVYSLLQFIKPLEILVSKSVRLTEQGNNRRKNLKSELKSGNLQKYFTRVQESIPEQHSRLSEYLQGLFPRYFLSYCSNPYLRLKPESLEQAAWAIFLLLIDNPDEQKEDLPLLVALLLIAHQLRNRHINPLKSTPVELNNPDKLTDMRYICYQAISILINTNIEGITRIGLKSSW
ncbi:MAG: hypothetical protein PHD40_08505 [Syntrophomonadaceae bacterium]|nr:hypothetical protein [Syntrophomonadaceae bacterium]